MSRTGDVVWAYGATWQRDESTAHPGAKNWWYSVTQSDGIGSPLADLKRHADFRWLVRDAQPVEHEAEFVELGRRLEREVIVKYLYSLDLADHVEHRIANVIAGWVERGEHLRGDDE